MSKQEDFYTVYRGRTSWPYQKAYLRVSKVLASKLVLSMADCELASKSVLDFGFGAGTFLLSCPKDCNIFGLELDQNNINAVTTLLTDEGFKNVSLEVVDEANWGEHRLFDNKYDLIVLSHVLEHFEDPINVLKTLSQALNPSGQILCLLPLNETLDDPHHHWIPDQVSIRNIAMNAGLEMAQYIEVDHVMYALRPFRLSESKVIVTIGRMLSFVVGVAASCVTPTIWFRLTSMLSYLGARPGQASFLLSPSGLKSIVQPQSSK